MKKYLVAVGLAVLTSTAFAELQQVESLNGKAQGISLGRVTTVLDGQCTGAKFQKIPEHTFLYALGGGALQPDAARQGEGLMLNGRQFIKTLDPACNFCTRTSEDEKNASGWGAFVAGIDFDAKPTARYRLNGTSETIEQIYTELAAKQGKLFAVAGAGHFATIETSAIRKAPVYGEPILGPLRSQYFHPKGVLRDADAIFFGMVLRSTADQTSATQMVFYVNPDDKATTGVQSHTHFATVSSPQGIDLTKPGTALGKVQEVAHLLTQSRMTNGELVVYRLDDIVQIGHE